MLIHDGARPFVSPALIARAIAAAERFGAAIPATRVTDTIKQIEGDRIVASPERASCAPRRRRKRSGSPSFWKPIARPPART